MLGHHKGMLIMLPDQAMVLTGKRALALSGGGTHATDAHIGGYDEVMGPNGQAHHKAATMIDAYRMVFSHHSLCSRRSFDRISTGRLLGSLKDYSSSALTAHAPVFGLRETRQKWGHKNPVFRQVPNLILKVTSFNSGRDSASPELTCRPKASGQDTSWTVKSLPAFQAASTSAAVR